MSYTRIQRIGAVRDEFQATRAALRYFVVEWNEVVKTDNTDALGFQEFRRALENVEQTYFVRLFSQCEAELRDYLREEGVRVPRYAVNLVNRVASRLTITADIVADVHKVREYRNVLVHEAKVPAAVVEFQDAVAFTNKFLAWLPEPKAGKGRA
jgi:hypothetical protein